MRGQLGFHANDAERLIGLTLTGNTFTFAKNNIVLSKAYNAVVLAGDYRQNEWAGACYSPDGEWLFVNIQTPGVTFAITGPWSAVRSRRENCTTTSGQVTHLAGRGTGIARCLGGAHLDPAQRLVLPERRQRIDQGRAAGWHVASPGSPRPERPERSAGR